MASSPTDGLYWENHWPLKVKEAADRSISHRTTKSPNIVTPVDDKPAFREWYSQPRSGNWSATLPRVSFYYATGSQYVVNLLGFDLFPIDSGPTRWVPGTPDIQGGGTYWNGKLNSDPFPDLLDPTIFRTERIDFSNTRWPMASSLREGVRATIERIESNPGPFCLGGHSEGAAVMSEVLKEIMGGSLIHRKPDFLGGVTFGNPYRETDHTWPGATWSGSWDVEYSTTGGHGCFPPRFRLEDTPSNWWDFVNDNDMATNTGDAIGGLGQEAIVEFMSANYSGGSIIRFIRELISQGGTQDNTELQEGIQGLREHNNEGHFAYPFEPPPGDPENGLTSYQIALNYLNRIGGKRQDQYRQTNPAETLQVNFKVPLSVSEITFEALRVPVRVEVWYQDRLNNWRPALNRSRVPVSVTISGSQKESWYKYHTHLYPLVAKAVQLRCTRVSDPSFRDGPYSIGIRNTLLRRNVYDRSDGLLPFEDELDPIGNVVSKYIKDWDSSRVLDDQPLTFWRSAPQPDHQAVVNLYLDLRTPEGLPQLVDALIIDPVYSGQNLNIYYTNDETVRNRKLSPVTLPASSDAETQWRSGKGRWDISDSPGSSYQFPLAVGPLISKDVWVGMEWSPDFDPVEEAPPTNPILFSVTPTTPTAAQWAPTIYYDSGAGEICLLLTNGEEDRLYSAALSPVLVKGDPLRIVVGWKYNPEEVLISVRTRSGEEIARLEETDPLLPAQVTIDGTAGFSDFRGLFTSHVVKLEDYAVSSESYQTNPWAYVAPEETTPDVNGRIPATTLDNAVYAADWTLQMHGSGGSHESFFEDKTWTPIWRNYQTARGRLAFPQTISARYIKMEFTNLTEEPYPVFDAGVQTTYKVYPIEVQQQSTTANPGLMGGAVGMLQLSGQLIAGAFGQGSVNWLNPTSVSNAVDAIFGKAVSPVTVNAGSAFTTTELPVTMNTSSADVTRTEAANPHVFRREPVDPQVLAAHTLLDWAGKLVDSGLHNTNSVAGAFFDSFTPLVNWIRHPAAPPVQGQDWWVFPGGGLALPAAVMNGLTALTEVVQGRKPTTETRLRFMTTSTHRYDTRTVTRDAAIAYFAGIREVKAVTTSYIAEQDPEVFNFSMYDPDRWVFVNMTQLESGPITTAGTVIDIENPGFNSELANWHFDEEEGWEWDDSKGRWAYGSATIEADGTEKNIRSTLFDVEEGQTISFSCWVATQHMTVADDVPPVILGVTTYLEGEVVEDLVVVDYIPPEEDGTLDGGLFDDDADLDTDGGDFGETPIGGDTILQWVQISGVWEVPAGVDRARVRLAVAEEGLTGQVWFDTVLINSGNGMGTAFKTITTTSSFSRLRCDFRDSGLVRSNQMWTRIDPLDTNISNLQLGYHVSTIPDDHTDGTTWADSFSNWADSDAEWGSAHALVSIRLDPDRTFQGQRVLKISRDAGAGEAGIKMTQHNNYFSGAVARLYLTFYKPFKNDNQITLRLRRISDGVYVHEEVITNPAVGYWYTYQGEFFEIPEDDDQNYKLEMVTTGSAADELYINDLGSEVALIRYFVRMGGPGEHLFDVTALRYADSAQVASTYPVNEATVECAVLSNRAFAYGCTLEPLYLK